MQGELDSPLHLIGEKMKDIKVIFKGNKSPSGKRTNVEYMVGNDKLELLKKSNLFDIEIIKEAPKPKLKPKAKKKSEGKD